MKILMLSQGLPFPVYRDGLTVRVYHLLAELTRLAECHLVCFGEYDLSQDEMYQLGRLVPSDVVPYRVPGGPVALAQKITSGRRYYSREFEVAVTKAVAHFQPDVVVAEQTFMGQYASACGRTPKVMSAVDAISLAALRQAEIAKRSWRMLEWLAWRAVARQRLAVERRFFPSFDRITAVAQEDASFLSENLGVGVDVIPNGVDVSHFAPAGDRRLRTAVVFSGNLSAPMNEEAALYLIREVFPHINARHPELQCVIAGRSPTPAIRAALPEYVTLRADVADMKDALCDAALYVSPIAYGTGIKNNVLQAMSLGIPTVATPLVARPISMSHEVTGFVASRGSEFVTAVLGALAGKAASDRIGDAGRSLILRRFSWRTVAEQYMDLFADVTLGSHTTHSRRGMR